MVKSSYWNALFTRTDLELDHVVDLFLDFDLVRLVKTRLIFRARITEQKFDDVEDDLLEGLDDDGVVLAKVEVTSGQGEAALVDNVSTQIWTSIKAIHTSCIWYCNVRQTVVLKQRDRKIIISVLTQSTVESADRCSECEWALKLIIWAVVVAQMVEWSLLIPKVCGLNTAKGKKLYWTFTVNCIENTKIKRKRPGIAHLKNLFWHHITVNCNMPKNKFQASTFLS